MARDDIQFRAPSSEFADADLQTLGDACHALSFELRLLNQPKRTAEERAALVARAAGLLHHAATAITPQPLMPGAPEYRVGDGPDAISQAFGAWYQQLQRTVRYHVVRRAADYVGTIAHHRSGAADTEENLMAQLRKLDAIHYAKK